MKLLCESVDHDGRLRFNEAIPYSEQMLATITRTNIDIVRSAIKVFTELHMMEIMDDGTYFMSEVQKMVGCETYWAQRKREQRIKELPPSKGVGHCPTMSNESPTCPSKSKIKSKSKEIDEDNNIVPKAPYKSEINDLFEYLWSLYPTKKGNGQISYSKKKELYSIGKDEMERAINRYLTELKKDADWRKPQNGSTFFNSGYVDYLDDNYVPSEDTATGDGIKAMQEKSPSAIRLFLMLQPLR